MHKLALPLIEVLSLSENTDGTISVNSREGRYTEFKQEFTDYMIKKSIKSVAAFANTDGGRIIFGVTDSPRILKGVPDGQGIDEAVISTLLNVICPCPDYQIREYEIHDKKIIELVVLPLLKPPAIITKTVRAVPPGKRDQKVMCQEGVVYTRKVGQSPPAASETYLAMLDKRDEYTRDSLFNNINLLRHVGPEEAMILHADPGKPFGEEEDGERTIYMTEEVARSCNIIERGKLVETDGAPAYEIKRELHVPYFAPDDPRGARKPTAAVAEITSTIEKHFGKNFPFTASNHLRKVANHLGFWNEETGDEIHTSTERVSGQPVYTQAGVKAIKDFIDGSPIEFVKIVGSLKIRQKFGAD